MNIGSLSLAQTPPLAVPLRLFLTAPLFAATGGVLLAATGGDLLASRWLPQLIALTHLFTLGFAAMAMFGAAQQILPVLAGSPVPRPQLVSRLLHLTLTPGTILLVAGLWHGAPALLLAALPLLAVAILTFVAVVLYCLFRARSAHATVRAMMLAVVSLLVTVLLGLHLGAGHALPAVPLARQFTDVHLAWGLLGWVGLLVTGVAYQVVPMFQITQDYPAPLTRWLAWAVFAGLLLWGVGRGWGVAAAAWGGIFLLATGYGAFGVVTLYLQSRRRRRLPDVTVDYWRLAMAALLAAIATWLASLLPGVPVATLQLLAAVLLVIGFVMGTICGMLYKIVPFLVWLHLNNRLQATGRWQGGIPNMKQVIAERQARWQYRCHAAALLLCSGAVVWPVLARPAGLALVVASAVLWWNLLGAARLYRRHAASTPAQ